VNVAAVTIHLCTILDCNANKNAQLANYFHEFGHYLTSSRAHA